MVLVDKVYLDNAATTRVLPEVAQAMVQAMTVDYGNPSSAHRMGGAGQGLLERAREQVARAIGADPAEVYFTSGGTEANALGVLGAARLHRGRHLVVSAIEHPSVLEAARRLRSEGWEVTEVGCGSDGVVSAEAVAEAVRPDTAVVALMWVQNELGTVQPVLEAARRIKDKAPRAHVHVDAVQALGKLPIDLKAMCGSIGPRGTSAPSDRNGRDERSGDTGGIGSNASNAYQRRDPVDHPQSAQPNVEPLIDSLALSAHKIHGPKGVGALWLRRGARVASLTIGGGQERGVRPGTENLPGAVGLGLAAELAEQARPGARTAMAALRKRLVDGARAIFPSLRVNGAAEHAAPHIVSLGFAGVPAEPLLHALEAHDVYVSAGSACAAKDKKPSAVLRAIAVPDDVGVIRISFSRHSTEAEVDRALAALRLVLPALTPRSDEKHGSTRRDDRDHRPRRRDARDHGSDDQRNGKASAADDRGDRP